MYLSEENPQGHTHRRHESEGWLKSEREHFRTLLAESASRWLVGQTHFPPLHRFEKLLNREHSHKNPSFLASLGKSENWTKVGAGCSWEGGVRWLEAVSPRQGHKPSESLPVQFAGCAACLLRGHPSPAQQRRTWMVETPAVLPGWGTRAPEHLWDSDYPLRGPEGISTISTKAEA